MSSKEGRLRVLNNQISLSSFTINVGVRDAYLPEVTPAFATQAGNTFGASIRAMGDLGRLAALAAVGISPWLAALMAVLGLVGSAIYGVVRWWR